MPPKKEPKKAELIDWYKKIPERLLLKSHNPHFDIHHIKIPFRMLIIGSSGSGKTQTLLSLIYKMPDTFENSHAPNIPTSWIIRIIGIKTSSFNPSCFSP